MEPRLNSGFLGTITVNITNGISIGSADFCRVHSHARRTDRQTHHAAPSVAI